MKTKDIFIGRVKSQHIENLQQEELPILLRQLDFTKYKALEGQKIYDIAQIELASLVPYTQIFDCGAYIFKGQAIKTYKSKLREKLPIKNLYIGNIGVMVERVKKEQDDEVKIVLKCSRIKTAALLLKDDTGGYLDLETFKKYHENNITVGQMRVVEKHRFLSDISEDSDIEESMELAKVLSKYKKIIN